MPYAALLLIALVIALVVLIVFLAQRRTPGAPEVQSYQLQDALADARRWVDRLGGQVLNLQGSNPASRQALVDASERYTAAGAQIESARSPLQAGFAKDTALEGLYYVRAARVAMDLDPGPDLPPTNQQSVAGSVQQPQQVPVDGHMLAAAPTPTSQTPHYYPGGMVAGRPVPSGWYSEPWWKSALQAGAWAAGTAVIFNALFDDDHF